jgi:TPR repeat protein
LTWNKSAADQGNAEACMSLGLMFIANDGFLPDFTAAIPWFTKAADRGIAEAEAILVEIHREIEKTAIIPSTTFTHNSKG